MIQYSPPIDQSIISILFRSSNQSIKSRQGLSVARFSSSFFWALDVMWARLRWPSCCKKIDTRCNSIMTLTKLLGM